MSHRLIRRLGTVAVEFSAARSALELVTKHWPIVHQRDEIIGQRLADFQLAERNLEATYVVRLFAEFEALLRDQYPHTRPGKAVPNRSDSLINGLGKHYKVPDAYRDDVHRIREFRHSVAHADPGVPLVTFSDALSRLNRYLSWIPDADVPG